ncbi:MAG TPA: lysylphosphatidylglycerol synthase transmembrane domain-containing protein [Solirubrobacteraceae bacterium]|nr:lysylphosphatidylglycerol synthase transmembrane domain-containing protein [Solirubrobacteraceae bacterium]
MSVETEAISLLGRVRRVAESLPFRILVTCGLLGLVAAQIDWSRMGSRFSHGHPLYFLAAVGLVFVALVVGGCRWLLLLRGADLDVRVGAVARIYSVATFSNTFLPTSVGGDVTRTLLVARRGTLLTRAAVSVVVDRLGGLAGLLGMAWLAFAFQSATVPDGAQVFLAWVTAAVVVGSALVATAVFRSPRLARALVPQRFISHAVEIRALLRGYAREPWTMFVVLCASLLYQALISLGLVMLADSIGVHLAYATAAVVLALVTVVTLIPISIGGFGVREGSYVVLLGGASIGATDAALISILSVAVLFVVSLPGAVMLARGGIAPALKAAPS